MATQTRARLCSAVGVYRLLLSFQWKVDKCMSLRKCNIEKDTTHSRAHAGEIHLCLVCIYYIYLHIVIMLWQLWRASFQFRTGSH